MNLRFKTVLVLALVFWITGPSEALAKPSMNQIKRFSRICATVQALKEGISAEWVLAIIQVESSWNPAALSPKGAMGLMQLMPATAKRFRVDNPFDIQQNIRGGVQYLSYLLRYFNGDLRLATAAYYAGEGRVSRRGLDYANKDVYAYVSKVAQLYQRLKHKQGVEL